MNPEFVKLTAAGFVVLTAASHINKKRRAKKTAPAMNYEPLFNYNLI